MSTKLPQREKARGKTIQGRVVSASMKNTLVVAVERFIKHPKYGKYIRITDRYKAHDPGNTKKVGEPVEIIECRPMSKDKHFKIIES